MGKKTVLLPVVAVLTLVGGGISTTTAHSEEEGGPFQKQIDYRTSVMTVFAWNLKPMGAMMKGEIPYDQKAFARHAQDLAAAASLDLLPAFPEDSDSADDTGAKAEIWMQWDDFVDKQQAMQSEVKMLAEVAAAGDQEQIKQQFAATADSCKACHKEYKE